MRAGRSIMPRAACLAAAFLAAVCVAEVAQKNADGVYELGHENFDDTIQSKSVVVVYFYADWCVRCKEFKTNWTQLMENTADLENVAFAELNTGDAQSLAEKYRVAAYPSVVVFRDGTDYPYDSKDYSAEAMTAAVKKFASSKWTKPDQYSHHLTTENFEETIRKGEPMLVKFYTRWCSHCRAMGAEWDKATKAGEKMDPPINMYQIDCEAEAQMCRSHKVDGYPAIRFYRNGRIIDTYSGGRKKKDFIDYLRRRSGPASIRLDATEKRINEHIDALHHRGQAAIIGFFPDEEMDGYSVYDLVANEIRDYIELVHVVSKDLGKKYGIEGEYGIHLVQPERLRSKYEEKFHVLDTFSPDEKDELKDWLYATSRPLVGHLQDHNTGIDRIYFKMNVATLYFTVDFGKEMAKSTQFWRQRLVEVAKHYREEKNLTFVIADDDEYSNTLRNIGLGDNAFDVSFSITGFEGREHFPLHEDWDEDLFREHIDNFLANKLEPYAKSEPVPARNNGPVKIVVAKNFKEMYTNNVDSNIIILFYAPWCKYCAELDPYYVKAARQAVALKLDITFMKFNIHENQMPRDFKEKVTGYPSVFFRARHSTETDKYHGNPKLSAINEFVMSHIRDAPSQGAVKEEL